MTQAAGVDDADAEVDAWRERKYAGCERYKVLKVTLAI